MKSMNAKITKWFGVVLSAVVLGLAVFYLIHTWKPADVNGWILWGASVLIAVRSVMRIASIAKQAGKSEE